MKLGTRFYGAAFLVMITIASLAEAIASLAEGGAFEPDNVVRVDTVTVQMMTEIPLRVDTVYERSLGICGVLQLDDGRVIAVTHVKPGLWGMYPVSQFDGDHGNWSAYRTCGGDVVEARTRGYVWANR